MVSLLIDLSGQENELKMSLSVVINKVHLQGASVFGFLLFKGFIHIGPVPSLTLAFTDYDIIKCF